MVRAVSCQRVEVRFLRRIECTTEIRFDFAQNLKLMPLALRNNDDRAQQADCKGYLDGDGHDWKPCRYNVLT